MHAVVELIVVSGSPTYRAWHIGRIIFALFAFDPLTQTQNFVVVNRRGTVIAERIDDVLFAHRTGVLRVTLDYYCILILQNLASTGADQYFVLNFA